MSKQIILASRSPRRVELLKQIGITPEVKPADIDESVQLGEPPAAYVLRLAQEKASAVYQQVGQGRLVLAADTTVALGDAILGKPVDHDDAFNMLKKLSGNTHHVHTAVAICANGQEASLLSSTLVEMVTLSDLDIQRYIESGEPFDKAGSYGIQGYAGLWVKRIEGSYTGVMGLPLCETASLLNQ